MPSAPDGLRLGSRDDCCDLCPAPAASEPEKPRAPWLPLRLRGSRSHLTLKILIINGPNLNLLGTREPAVYGSATLAEVEALCRDTGARLGLAIECRQSNHEGELIDWIQQAGREQAAGELLGVVLNAGAYTHTSVALHDAIKGSGARVIEIHISNVHAREPFRHHSYLSPVASGIVIGFGIDGYALAIEGLTRRAAAKGHAQ
jgi:3-dehydroquinate dehydratase-2